MYMYIYIYCIPQIPMYSMYFITNKEIVLTLSYLALGDFGH